MTKEAIRSIQTGLAALGYAPGKVDGLNGPKTRAAAAEFARGAAPIAPAPEAAIKPNGEIRQGSARHLVMEIVIHCAATTKSWADGKTPEDMLAEVRRWHVKDNGWNDIGYHWVIAPDGTVLPGRAETVIGAGVAGHNSGVIHICLIGGHGSAETDQFADHFTAAQRKALLAKLADIQSRTPIKRISGHNEWAAKACPGFNVPGFLKSN